MLVSKASTIVIFILRTANLSCFSRTQGKKSSLKELVIAKHLCDAWSGKLAVQAIKIRQEQARGSEREVARNLGLI